MISQNKKTIWTAFLSLFLFFWGADLLIPHALAAPNVAGNEYIQEIAEKLEIFHQLFSPLINFFSTHIGNFLGNDYIFAGTMGEMIKNLWVISRNIVNIFFVGALLWVALKAVAGDFFGEETDLKKEILKIAVFLVAVNFSWLATKVVLDASNVATNVVFSLPTGVSNVAEVDLGGCTIDSETGKTKGSCKPSAIYYVAGADEKQHLSTEECKTQKIEEAYKSTFPDGLQGEPDPNEPDEYKNKTTFCWDRLDLFDYNQNTAVVYLTYGMANIQNLGEEHAETNNFFKMALASLFSLLIQITYTVALLALFILMVIRMAMLWLFVGFSPALVVMLYLGGGEGPVSNFGPKDFIKWAFVPAQVGLILSAGFIMIAAGQANSELLASLNQNVNLDGGFYNLMSIFSGIDTTFNLVWLIVVELVFAIAVYAPMKEMPFAGTIIGPIADFAKSTLTSLAKTPLIAPIVPVTNPSGGSDRVSLRDISQAFQSKIQWREGASSDYKSINKLEEQAEELNQHLKRNTNEKTEIIQHAREGRVHRTLDAKFDLPLFRQMAEDQQEGFLEDAGFEKKEERDIIIKAINKGSGTAPTTAPTPVAPEAQVPATPAAQMEQKASEFALRTGAPEVRASIITQVNAGNLDELNKIGINLQEFIKLPDPEKTSVLKKAGFIDQDIIAILGKINKPAEVTP